MIRNIVAPLRSRLNIRRHPIVRKYIPLLLLATILFAAVALLDSRLANLRVTIHLAVLVFIALAMGSLVTWLFDKKVFQDQTILQRTMLLLIVVLWGVFIFTVISPHIGRTGSKQVYLELYMPSLLLFLLPWFYWRAVTALANVPQLRYAPLVFESLKDVIAAFRFAEDETKGIRWVFEDDFQEVDPSGLYAFRTFTPKDVKDLNLGQLFKGVISLHNITECPQKPIDFKSGNDFYGWEFYHYPYWFWPQRKRYLSPVKALRKLGVRFKRVSEEERAKSIVKLVPKFRAATIYVNRSK